MKNEEINLDSNNENGDEEINLKSNNENEDEDLSDNSDDTEEEEMECMKALMLMMKMRI